MTNVGLETSLWSSQSGAILLERRVNTVTIACCPQNFLESCRQLLDGLKLISSDCCTPDSGLDNDEEQEVWFLFWNKTKHLFGNVWKH